MQSLAKYLSEIPEAPERATEWLQLLVGDWNLLADLLRSDLVLWTPHEDGARAIAHARPSTGPTVYYEDPVGDLVTRAEAPELMALLLDGADPTWATEHVQREGRDADLLLVPVVRDGAVLGVLAVERAAVELESPSERMQHGLGERLLRMMHQGAYPIEGAPIPPRRGAPRVADGVVEIDVNGTVLAISPNAVSAFHRFGITGDLIGRVLAEPVTDLIQTRSAVDESLPLVLMGRAAWRSDIQARSGTLSLRAVPLTEDGQRDGAVLLVRDVSELRRRERELMTKDATIREVHHRVKNNLQTVAALLRMQSRRMSSPEARAALEEAMRRVSTIALVHESLLTGSEEKVHFDDVIDRCLRLAVDAASASVRRVDAPELAKGQVGVRTEKIGRVGTIRAEEATPLALVVTELSTNAVEHGLSETGGTLCIRSERVGGRLVVQIEDDGVGFSGRAPSGLGTSIATSLVEGELGGVLSWLRRPEGGTIARIEVDLDPSGA